MVGKDKRSRSTKQ